MVVDLTVFHPENSVCEREDPWVVRHDNCCAIRLLADLADQADDFFAIARGEGEIDIHVDVIRHEVARTVTVDKVHTACVEASERQIVVTDDRV